MGPLYGRAILEWPLLLASATVFGTAFFAIVVGDQDGLPRDAMVCAVAPVWRMAAVAIAVISPFVLLGITAEMAGTSLRSAVALVPEVMAQTHAGEVWRTFLPVAAILVFAVLLPMSAWTRILAVCACAALLIFLEALAGHAIDKGPVAVAIDFVHEAAAGTWIGALIAFRMTAHRTAPPPLWVEKAARKVSTTAAWSVAAIAISGSFSAYQELGLDLYRLLYSTYGRTLVIKVVVFCVVLSIAAYNRERLMPEVSKADVQSTLLRNVGFESLILGLAVMGLASLLGNTPPATGHMMMHSHAVADRPVAHHAEMHLEPIKSK